MGVTILAGNLVKIKNINHKEKEKLQINKLNKIIKFIMRIS